MKSFKKFVAEVAQPKPEEEKRFKDMHSYETKPHPVATDAQHTGEIAKPKAKRLADQEGDANYDKALKDAEKRMVPESTEMDRARYDADDDTKKKKVTLPKAPWEKKEELSAKQKKIDHNKNGKIDGHDLAMIRKKKNEEVELDETTSSALKRPVNQTGPDGKTRTVMKKAKADKTDDRGQDQIGTNESNQIDEAVSFKKGPIRLKNGKQVMVSMQDAKLLTQMFKDLSPANQRQMQKVAMTDEAGFEEIVGFAREAL